MSAITFNYGPIRHTKPAIFAGLPCQVVEDIGGAGVVVFIPGPKVKLYSDDDYPDLNDLVRIGTLRCSSCAREVRFSLCGGLTVIFPWTPAPGWIAWNPPAVNAEPNQAIAVMVRCPGCDEALRARWGWAFGSAY
jgi:hypothetical protein